MNKLIIASIIAIVIIIIIVIIFYVNRQRTPTLYDRLGGIFPIAAVVDHFSDSLIDNPIVGKNSSNKFLSDWHTNKLNRLPGLKWMRTLWVASITGGPFKYVGTKPGKCPFSLENAHRNLHISSIEFDAVATELEKSLNYFNVPIQEKREVLEAFMSHKNDIVMGYNIKC
jgi:hemoglobin